MELRGSHQGDLAATFGGALGSKYPVFLRSVRTEINVEFAHSAGEFPSGSKPLLSVPIAGIRGYNSSSGCAQSASSGVP